jgi:hypothetical protein
MCQSRSNLSFSVKGRTIHTGRILLRFPRYSGGGLYTPVESFLGIIEDMAERIVFLMSKKSPFYMERPVKFKWQKGRTLKAAKINSQNLRDAARHEGIKIYEISRAGEDFSEFSAFKLLVQVKPNYIKLPLEIVYQYAKLWEGKDEAVNPLDEDALISGKPGVKKSRAVKKKVKEMGEGKVLKCFQINFGGGEKVNFSHKPEDAFYNWLYIMTLRQRHNRELNERLLKLLSDKLEESETIGFSDIFFTYKGKQVVRYNCQARAVAQYLSIYRFCEKEIDEIFPQTDSLYEIRDRLSIIYNKFVDFAYQPNRSDSESINSMVSTSHDTASNETANVQSNPPQLALPFESPSSDPCRSTPRQGRVPR